MEFKDLFFLWRRENSLTQIEAADLIGISRSSYNRFEKWGLAGLKVYQKIQAYYQSNKKEFGGEEIGRERICF